MIWSRARNPLINSCISPLLLHRRRRSPPTPPFRREMAEEAILGFLQTSDEIPDSGVFAAGHGLDHKDVVNVIKSLHGFGFVEAQDIKKESWVLTDEGKLYAAAGSPEVQLFLAIPPEGISLIELQKKLDSSVFEIGKSKAMKNKWVEIKQLAFRKVEHVKDEVQQLLLKVQNGEGVEPKEIALLKSRKLIAPQIWKGYSVRKGPKYAPKRKKAATDLTREHLQRGDWKELEFKEYNFNAKGPPAEGGHLHPLVKVRKQLKMIFLQMGFEEMPTSNYVESSFWNFDALFQPQQHPARDSHDTFFLQAPSTTSRLPEDYVERVKNVHEHGGYGSRGPTMILYGIDNIRDLFGHKVDLWLIKRNPICRIGIDGVDSETSQDIV